MRLRWILVILGVGLLLWATSGLFFPVKQESRIAYKREAPPMMSEKSDKDFSAQEKANAQEVRPKVDVYSEIKFWAEWIGKILSGIGSIGIVYKAITSLGRKK